MKTARILLSLALAAPLWAQTRPAAVAGQFYPRDARELTQTVDRLLAKAPAAGEETPLALVSPHAGYPFSGPVAAFAYATLKGRKIDRVVVIAPSHSDAFNFSSVYEGEAYSTPLGRVPVDRAFAAALTAGRNPLIALSSRGHTTAAGRTEHSLEVQLPFLQRALGSFKLVPIVMGDQSYAACRALGLALARLIPGPGTLIVASSDLSHYHPYEQAVRLDRKTLNAVQEWDYLSLSRNLQQNIWEACGGGPIVAAMIAAERLGATEARLLKYANSGDTTGERGQVVGYGAMALVKSVKPRAATAPFSLTAAERQELLKLARQSVEWAVKNHKLLDYSGSQLEALMQERGAFVTLKEKGQLRGCIGYVSPTRPLALTVRDVAAYAALRDERFPPVAPAELAALDYEISVLSPLRRVTDVKQIQVGRHGLVMKRGDREGLLLPQVPVEEHWDRATFLDQTCLKAGLPPRSWQDNQTDIFSFTAVVFSK